MRVGHLALCLTAIILGGCAARQPTRFLYAWLQATPAQAALPDSRDTAIVSVDYHGVEVTGRALQPDMGGEIRPQVVQKGRLVVLQITSGPGSMDLVGHPSYHVALALAPGRYTLEVQHAWTDIFLAPHLSYRGRYSVTVAARPTQGP